MNTHTLKATATALREKLEALEGQNSDAKLMLNTLRGLLLKAENGKIHAPMEARDIPGYRYLPETNLQDDRDLSQLFAEFYMALIDGEEWSSFKKFQAKNKNHD